MFGFGKSSNKKHFEESLAFIIKTNTINGAANSICLCWKIFNAKYEDASKWRNSKANQTEWFGVLKSMLESTGDLERKGKAPPGSVDGLWMCHFFFSAIAEGEDASTINAMSTELEKLNRIGFELSR